MGLVLPSKMKRKYEVLKGFNPKSGVNVLLLYQPLNNLGKRMPDNQLLEKVTILNKLWARKASCIAKDFRKGPEFATAYITIPAKYGRSQYDGKILRTCIAEELTRIMSLITESDSVK